MKRWLLLVLALSVPFSASAADPSADWKYSKTIIYPPFIESSAIDVAIDNDLSTQLFDGYRDIRVFDADGNEVPYTLSGEKQANLGVDARPVAVVVDGEAISLDDVQIQNLFDDNRKSFFEIPVGANEVSLTFEFPTPKTLDKVNIFTYDTFNTWESIQVEASNDQLAWTILRSEIDIDHAVWRWIGFPPYTTEYSFYRVTFEPLGALRIHELALLSNNDATLTFEAKEDVRYLLYYGNPSAPRVEYLDAQYTESLSAILGDQKRNGSWNTDPDEDGIGFSQDVCPYVADANQIDTDADGRGDACEEEAPDYTSEDMNTSSSEYSSDTSSLDTQPDDGETEISASAPEIDQNTNPPTSGGTAPIVKSATSLIGGIGSNELVIYAIVVFVLGIFLGMWMIGSGIEGVDKPKKKVKISKK